MRRADRLFRIIQILREGRLVTARALAERLEISKRTVYRDMRDLMASGVPIDGEAGVGYLLRDGYDLPPLMFDREELEALMVGARMLRGWADPKLASGAQSALDKIHTVLPGHLRGEAAASTVFVPDFHPYPVHQLTPLRTAMTAQRKVYFAYTRADGQASRRVVYPLGLFFWGKVWTLVAWCEWRAAFRHFRIDRMREIRLLEEVFELQPGQTLSDFFALMEAECAARGEPVPDSAALPSKPANG